MLKDYAIIKEIGNKIRGAADTTVREVFNDYSDLNGREEELTAQIRGEINRHLLKNVTHALDGKDINGCKIQVATFKKKQEKTVGADLAGIIEIKLAGRTISKAFLAQAKVGHSYQGSNGQILVRATNKDVVKQAENMLKISSDSFIMIYSRNGIACVPAFQVALAGSGTIDTASHPFHSFGQFFEEFFKCFIGDHLISPHALNAKNLEDYAVKVNANSILKLSVQLPARK